MSEQWIPLAAIVLSLGMGFWKIFYDFQRRRLQFEERRVMIERGLTPPPLAEPRRRQGTPEESLRPGLILLFLGLGLGTSYLVLRGWGPGFDRDLLWMLLIGALVVLFLGAGYLTHYAVAKKQSARSLTDAPNGLG